MFSKKKNYILSLQFNWKDTCKLVTGFEYSDFISDCEFISLGFKSPVFNFDWVVIPEQKMFFCQKTGNFKSLRSEVIYENVIYGKHNENKFNVNCELYSISSKKHIFQIVYKEDSGNILSENKNKIVSIVFDSRYFNFKYNNSMFAERLEFDLYETIFSGDSKKLSKNLSDKDKFDLLLSDEPIEDDNTDTSFSRSVIKYILNE